jgi:DNA mismatch endonuclease Vsr
MPDIFDTEKRSEIMRSVKNKDTLPELIVQSLIRDLGIEYERNYKVLCCKPDIVISAIHKVIFIHGCFWHGHTCKRGQLPATNSAFWEAKITKNKERDKRNYAELEENGWDYLVLWGCELKKKNLEKLVDKITRFLYNQKPEVYE